ncbi:MAG: fibronectin type III domain-containing protein [Clostridia bacterium]|nr:fibronectin type III domain-containing protein [Clostridia bacterium]
MKKTIILLTFLFSFTLCGSLFSSAMAPPDTSVTANVPDLTVTQPSTTEPTTAESTTVPATTAPSTTKPAAKPKVKLSTPTGLTFSSATTTSITIKWKAVPGAESYSIYCGVSGKDGYTLVGKSKSTSFTVTGLNGKYRYKIKIKATAKGKTTSDYSKLIKLYTVPPRAAKPEFVSRDGASVTLKWAKTGRENFYEVYVASSKNGKYRKVTTTKKTTFTYEKKTPEKAYYFKIVPVIDTKDQYLKGKASKIKKTYIGKISVELPDIIRKGEYPEITVPYYNSKVKWKSSDKSVIKIKDGRLYAVGQGKAKLTAIYKKKYKRTVTVKVSAPTLSYMSAVYDVTNKEYIYHNRLNERCYPASITKLVTALVALKYMDEDDTITVGSELNMVEAYSSRCDIKWGEKFRLRDILYGLLLPSGGDAAYTVAVNCARKVSGNKNMGYVAAKNYFVKLMNEYMDDIGATGSHFVNPHGYPVKGHYSTVHDLVLVANKVLKNKTLKSITSTSYKYVRALTGEGHSWGTTNSLIASYAYYYSPYAIGMKTGTVEDDYTGIIGAFKKNNKTYITVVIGCESYNARYDATHKLIRTYL